MSSSRIQACLFQRKQKIICVLQKITIIIKEYFTENETQKNVSAVFVCDQLMYMEPKSTITTY